LGATRSARRRLVGRGRSTRGGRRVSGAADPGAPADTARMTGSPLLANRDHRRALRVVIHEPPLVLSSLPSSQRPSGPAPRRDIAMPPQRRHRRRKRDAAILVPAALLLGLVGAVGVVGAQTAQAPAANVFVPVTPE